MRILASTSPLRPERQEIANVEERPKEKKTCFIACTQFQNGISSISAEQVYYIP